MTKEEYLNLKPGDLIVDPGEDGETEEILCFLGYDGPDKLRFNFIYVMCSRRSREVDDGAVGKTDWFYALSNEGHDYGTFMNRCWSNATIIKNPNR